jgi:hypothetical protein
MCLSVRSDGYLPLSRPSELCRSVESCVVEDPRPSGPGSGCVIRPRPVLACDEGLAWRRATGVMGDLVIGYNKRSSRCAARCIRESLTL